MQESQLLSKLRTHRTSQELWVQVDIPSTENKPEPETLVSQITGVRIINVQPGQETIEIQLGINQLQLVLKGQEANDMLIELRHSGVYQSGKAKPATP